MENNTKKSQVSTNDCAWTEVTSSAVSILLHYGTARLSVWRTIRQRLFESTGSSPKHFWAKIQSIMFYSIYQEPCSKIQQQPTWSTRNGYKKYLDSDLCYFSLCMHLYDSILFVEKAKMIFNHANDILTFMTQIQLINYTFKKINVGTHSWK